MDKRFIIWFILENVYPVDKQSPIYYNAPNVHATQLRKKPIWICLSCSNDPVTLFHSKQKPYANMNFVKT